MDDGLLLTICPPQSSWRAQWGKVVESAEKEDEEAVLAIL